MSDIESIDFKSLMRNSTCDIFDKMLSMSVETVDSEQAHIQETHKIVGSVGLAGEVVGCINIHVDTALAQTITANMLGEDPENIEDEEILDVVGELSNMIGGNLKSCLCDAGLACSLSIPIATSGKNFAIGSKDWLRHERCAFQSNEHVALVEFYIKSNNQH